MNEEENGILVNADVLDEDYLLEAVHAMEPQIKELKFCLEPLLQRRSTCHPLLAVWETRDRKDRDSDVHNFSTGVCLKGPGNPCELLGEEYPLLGSENLTELV